MTSGHPHGLGHFDIVKVSDLKKLSSHIVR